MALYRVVIVEDEERIRNGLRKCINWSEMGFEVVGAFEDGESALNYISENPCEVVMTDIMMGAMSGLELIGELKVLDSKLKIIIVSGYSDYSYMKQAIKYKVDDYLLKPVERVELEKVYSALKKELDEEKRDLILQDSFIGPMIDLYDEKNESVNTKKQLPFYKKLIAALNSEDEEQIEAIIAEMMQEYECLTQEEIGDNLKKIYYTIAVEFKKRNIDVIRISEGMFNYNKLPDRSTPQAMEQYIVQSFKCLCQGLKHVEQDYDNDLVENVIDYINRHVMEDIGNEVIAIKFSVHPSYLCRVFRKKTGEYLADYILRVKVKKTIQLLKTEKYKVAEIAEMMGYSSGNYFSTQFKKYTGYSPSEYSCRVLKK